MKKRLSFRVDVLFDRIDCLEERVERLEALVMRSAEARADRRRRLDEPEEPSAEIA